MDFDIFELLGQILSIIAMGLTIFSFQMKKRKQILIFQTVGTGFFLASFLLLGSWTAACLNVVFLARNIIFYFGEDKKWAKHPIWLPVILAAVIGAGALGYVSPLDLLPIIGSIFGTVATYMKNENTFRLLKLGDSPLWLAYNAVIPSIGGVICEVFNIISIIVALIRYRKKKV